MNFLLDLVSDDGIPDFEVTGIDYRAFCIFLGVIILIAFAVIITMGLKIFSLNCKLIEAEDKLKEAESKTQESTQS